MQNVAKRWAKEIQDSQPGRTNMATTMTKLTIQLLLDIAGYHLPLQKIQFPEVGSLERIIQQAEDNATELFPVSTFNCLVQIVHTMSQVLMKFSIHRNA